MVHSKDVIYEGAKIWLSLEQDKKMLFLDYISHGLKTLEKRCLKCLKCGVNANVCD